MQSLIAGDDSDTRKSQMEQSKRIYLLAELTVLPEFLMTEKARSSTHSFLLSRGRL